MAFLCVQKIKTPNCVANLNTFVKCLVVWIKHQTSEIKRKNTDVVFSRMLRDGRFSVRLFVCFNQIRKWFSIISACTKLNMPWGAMSLRCIHFAQINEFCCNRNWNFIYQIHFHFHLQISFDGYKLGSIPYSIGLMNALFGNWIQREHPYRAVQSRAVHCMYVVRQIIK